MVNEVAATLRKNVRVVRGVVAAVRSRRARGRVGPVVVGPVVVGAVVVGAPRVVGPVREVALAPMRLSVAVSVTALTIWAET